MGPQLIIDKSTLQSLSYNEVSNFNIHYYAVYVPTLFIEILGDLKKFQNSEESKREVQKIAKKISGIGLIRIDNKGGRQPAKKYLLLHQVMYS